MKEKIRVSGALLAIGKVVYEKSPKRMYEIEVEGVIMESARNGSLRPVNGMYGKGFVN